MKERTSSAEWKGGLKRGKGNISLGSGEYEGHYSFPSRFKEGEGTNPEELIGAAHAGCFSMALAMILEEMGYEPKSIETDATVSLDEKLDVPEISSVSLSTRASAPEISQEDFQKAAEEAKENCPVSKALDVPISLEAELV
ncbi:MAG: OsmC family protein [Candidatus Hadarchaeia archaeon]